MKHRFKIDEVDDLNFILQCRWCGIRIYMWRQVVHNLLLVPTYRINARREYMPSCAMTSESIQYENYLRRRRAMKYERR